MARWTVMIVPIVKVRRLRFISVPERRQNPPWYSSSTLLFSTSKGRSLTGRCDLRSREGLKTPSLIRSLFPSTCNRMSLFLFCFFFIVESFDFSSIGLLASRERKRGGRWVSRSRLWLLISTKGISLAIAPIRGRSGRISAWVWSPAIPLPSFALSKVSSW